MIRQIPLDNSDTLIKHDDFFEEIWVSTWIHERFSLIEIMSVHFRLSYDSEKKGRFLTHITSHSFVASALSVISPPSLSCWMLLMVSCSTWRLKWRPDDEFEHFKLSCPHYISGSPGCWTWWQSSLVLWILASSSSLETQQVCVCLCADVHVHPVAVCEASSENKHSLSLSVDLINSSEQWNSNEQHGFN